MGELSKLKCEPVHGFIPPIADQEIELYLQELPEWRVVEQSGEKRLERIFRFKNFRQALDFTAQVGEQAELEDHHPLIQTEWGRVTVQWWTHAVGGLHKNDFIMAAKEMGASDARIIFRHLYPNTLSHIIVILTLTIPSVILAEAFLSFLGIGIQEPLISWGLMMRNAQDIQVLGSAQWILSPVAFIIMAVLGFNFLGDGLRDAADPYANV